MNSLRKMLQVLAAGDALLVLLLVNVGQVSAQNTGSDAGLTPCANDGDCERVFGAEVHCAPGWVYRLDLAIPIHPAHRLSFALPSFPLIADTAVMLVQVCP